jgi:deoxycytidine triphosphate deaminase
MMSVIPLTTEGDDRTIVQNQADFRLEGDALLIIGLDPTQLQRGTSNVSYDLRIGAQCRDHRGNTVKTIPEGGVLTLRSGAAVIIQTEESIHLPRRLFGIIAPKVSLLELGLSSTFSKVDPGYNGHLLITLFNLGKSTVTLHRREVFCSLTLIAVAPGAYLYEKGPKQITAQSVKQPRRSFRDWVEVNHTVVTIVLIFATLALGIEHLAVFLLSRHAAH